MRVVNVSWSKQFLKGRFPGSVARRFPLMRARTWQMGDRKVVTQVFPDIIAIECHQRVPTGNSWVVTGKMFRLPESLKKAEEFLDRLECWLTNGSAP